MPVVVAGMYRNGTTLMASVLKDVIGLYGGTEPYLKQKNLEHRLFIKQSNKILKAFGGTAFDANRIKQFVESFNFNEFDYEKILGWDVTSYKVISSLELNMGMAPDFFWKDTRLPLTIPFWYRLIPEAKYIVPYRHPDHSIASMHRIRNKWSRFNKTYPYENGLYLWETYHSRLLSWLESNPDVSIMGVDYDDWFNDFEGVRVRLETYLGYNVSRSSLNKVFNPTNKPPLHNMNNDIYNALKKGFSMRKFQEEYDKFFENQVNKGEEGTSYIEWLEIEYGNSKTLRDAIIGINAMIRLYTPDVIWYDGMPLTEAVGVLIAKATNNKNESVTHAITSNKPDIE